MYSPENITNRLLEIINKIWRDEGFLINAWRKAIIVPIHKKENKDNIANYRRITLLDIYTRSTS